MANKHTKKKRKAKTKKREAKKQRETKKKEGKTEIEIGFEPHTPQIVERKKKEMEEADIIVPELGSATIGALKRAEGKEKIKNLAERLTGYPEYSEEMFKIYKKMQEEGKEIKGVEGRTRFSSNARMKGTEASKKGKVKKAAEELAKSNKERQRERVKKLKEMIRKNPGKKIYIEAGGFHTPIYRKLKKELEEKDVEIKRKHLGEKELHEKAGYPERVKEVYPPKSQLQKHFGEETETAQRYKELQEAREKGKNPERYFDSKEEYKRAKQAEKKIEDLVEETKEFKEIKEEKQKNKMDSGMSKEKAGYEARLKTLEEMKEKKKEK